MVRSAFDMRSPVTLQQKVQSGLLAGLGRFSDLVEVMELKGGNAGIGIKFNEFLGLGKSRSGKKKKKIASQTLPASQSPEGLVETQRVLGSTPECLVQ